MSGQPFLILGISLLLASVTVLPETNADVRLPKVFSNHMVLQRELPIHVWGWADPAEKVQVEFAGQRVNTQADQTGEWSVQLKPMKSDGKKHRLVIIGRNKIVFENVVLGEVWFCGGQSNMNRTTDIRKKSDADVRLFWIDFSLTPCEDDLNDGFAAWTPSTPDDLPNANAISEGRFQGKPRTGFTEVGYVFGERLRKELDVPVGLIQCTVGGSTAKAWTPVPSDFPAKYPFGKAVEKKPYIAHTPGLLYQTMVHGITPFTIRGVIWYQGENDGRNRKYADDLTHLIQSWRKKFDRPKMPFYMVQIAQTTYASGMLGVWEAQVQVCSAVEATGLASSNNLQDKSIRIDEGNPKQKKSGTGWPIVAGSNPHPPNKHLVAERLANIALSKTYRKLDREVFAPIYRSHEIKDNKIVVQFSNVGDGLKTDDQQPPIWFEVSDGSKIDERPNALLKYVKAQAKIVSKDEVLVWSDEIDAPKYVRFSWHTLGRHNLTNSEKLPAISFRTDDLKQMWNRR